LQGASVIFQGSIVLLAQYLQPILTNAAIAEITCAGSLMIMAHTLLVIFMANLGASLGTFIAGADIIRQMVRY